MRRALSIFCIVFALTGCGRGEIKAALDEAKAASSASVALAIIRKAGAENCRPVRKGCLPADELARAEDEYFALAARAGDPKIVRELYTRPVGNALQWELKARVLEEAKQSTNPDLLFAAGRIVYDGEGEVRDTKAALHFFERAWAAGSDDAAGIVARIYERAGDRENAYLWSLRCIGICDRGAGTKIGERINAIELVELEKSLSVPTIERVQQAAKQR